MPLKRALVLAAALLSIPNVNARKPKVAKVGNKRGKKQKSKKAEKPTEPPVYSTPAAEEGQRMAFTDVKKRFDVNSKTQMKTLKDNLKAKVRSMAIDQVKPMIKDAAISTFEQVLAFAVDKAKL